MTSKQRSYLKGLAMNLEPVFQIGKSSVTPENVEAISEVFNTRELVKISILKNCLDRMSIGLIEPRIFPIPPRTTKLALRLYR